MIESRMIETDKKTFRIERLGYRIKAVFPVGVGVNVWLLGWSEEKANKQDGKGGEEKHPRILSLIGCPGCPLARGRNLENIKLTTHTGEIDFNCKFKKEQKGVEITPCEAEEGVVDMEFIERVREIIKSSEHQRERYKKR